MKNENRDIKVCEKWKYRYESVWKMKIKTQKCVKNENEAIKVSGKWKWSRKSVWKKKIDS